MIVLLLSNLAATLFLTGLVWVLQVVQFPLMLRAGGLDFPNYIEDQRRRNTLLMTLPMLIELITAVWLLLKDPSTIYAALLLAIIWIVTFASIVPIHSKLGNCFDQVAIRTLIHRNWIRTICWSLRAGLLLWLARQRFC